MDEDEDLDIAAAMGFSSFGGTKKRKHDQTESPKAGGSGANTTELGVRTKRGAGDEVNMVNPGAMAASTDARNPSARQSKKKQQPPAAGLADFLARAQTLPEKPPERGNVQSERDHVQQEATTEMRSFGGPSVSKAELSALYHGVTNERGDSVIFLTNFVEDPWSRMKDPR